MFAFNAKIEAAENLEKTLIGRREIVAYLEKQVLRLAETDKSFQALLIGPRGSGKTHQLKVLYNRVHNKPSVKRKIAIAYMSEDEYGIDTYLDLMIRIFNAFIRRETDEKQKQFLLDKIEILKHTEAKYRIAYAEKYLLEYLNGRELLILIENLNDIFKGLKQNGQSKWRDFIQQHRNTSIVATSQAIFTDVSKKEKPFHNFFNVTHLKKLTFEEAQNFMMTLAEMENHDKLIEELKTPRGIGNLKAIYQFTEGNHRLLVTFFDFLKTDFKSELSKPFLKMIDQLKPYYEGFVDKLPAQQQKIIQYLALQRIPQKGKDIALNCFLNPTTLSKQMSQLRQLGFVDVHKEGRDAYYEIAEPLLRICIEINENREGIIKLFVDFLGNMYSSFDLKLGFLKFSFMSDFVEENLKMKYFEESKYYRSAVEHYAEDWKLSSEQEKELLKYKTENERMLFIYLVVFSSEFNMDAFNMAIESEDYQECLNLTLSFTKVHRKHKSLFSILLLHLNSQESNSYNYWNNISILNIFYGKEIKVFEAAQKALSIDRTNSKVYQNLIEVCSILSLKNLAKKSLNKLKLIENDIALIIKSAGIIDVEFNELEELPKLIDSSIKKDELLTTIIGISAFILGRRDETLINLLIQDEKFQNALTSLKLTPNQFFSTILKFTIRGIEIIPIDELKYYYKLFKDNRNLKSLNLINLKFLKIAIRYYKENDKKAIYELTKEERETFFILTNPEKEKETFELK